MILVVQSLKASFTIATPYLGQEHFYIRQRADQSKNNIIFSNEIQATFLSFALHGRTGYTGVVLMWLPQHAIIPIKQQGKSRGSMISKSHLGSPVIAFVIETIQARQPKTI
jgi:hypothetical protein